MKLGEQVGNRALDLLVGILDDDAVLVIDEADRQRMALFTAVGRGQLRPVQPAVQEMQLDLRHLALKAEQDPVVDVGQVVHAVDVDEQRVGQPGQLHQPGQVGIGPAEPGHLQAEHRADHAAAALAALGVQTTVLDGARVTSVLSVAVDPYTPSDASWPRTRPGAPIMSGDPT